LSLQRTLIQVWQIIGNLAQPNLPTLILSFFVAGAIMVGHRIASRLPIPLFAVVGAIWASARFGFAAQGVVVVGPVPGGLPSSGGPT